MLFALGVGLNSNAQERFSEVEGINNNAWTNHVVVDGNTYVSGTYSYTTTYSKYTVTRRDVNGAVLLSKDLDVRADSELNTTGHLIKLNDGNFLLASVYRSLSDVNIRKIYAISFTPTFDTLWTKTYTRKATNDDISYTNSVVEVSDGFVFVGASVDDNSKTYLYSFKTDKNGDMIWEQYYPVVGDFKDVEPTPDGGYLMSGFADRDNPDVNPGISREGYLLKVDADGNKEWDSIYPNKVIDGGTLFFYDMTATQDGNYLVMATYTSKLKNDGWAQDIDAVLIKLNPNGEIIWEKYLGVVGDGHRTYLVSVSEANDGTILLGGESTIGGGGLKGMFFKLTPLGEVVWEQYYRHDTRTGDHYISDIAATDDGGVVGCGTSSFSQDGWLIKLDCNGCLDATCVDDGVACTTYDCATDNQPEALFTVPAPPYQATAGNNYNLNVSNESTYSGAYEWYIDNVYQGDFVNPNFDLLSGATYEIRLVAKNLSCTDEYTMTITVDEVLGLNEYTKNSLQLYPNPAKDNIMLSSSNIIEYIEISDVTGKTVLKKRLNANAALLDVSLLSEGMYYFNAHDQNGLIAIKKLIIK